LLVLLLHLRRIGPYLAAAGYGVACSAVPVAICLRGPIAARLALAGTLQRNPLGIVSRHGRPTAVPAALISCRPGSRSYDQAPRRHSPGRDSLHRESGGPVDLLPGERPPQYWILGARSAYRCGNRAAFEQRGYRSLDR